MENKDSFSIDFAKTQAPKVRRKRTVSEQEIREERLDTGKMPSRRSDEKENEGPPQWNWEKETLSFLGAAVLIVGLAFLPEHEAAGKHIALGASLPVWTILPFF